MTKTFKNFASFLFDIIKLVLISLIIIIPIRAFIVQPFFVKGQSMEPSFYNGEYLIVDEISYHFNTPQRGQVIVFKNPNNPEQYYIKRIIGLPEESIKIENGKIYVYNKEHPQGIVLDESSYLHVANTSGDIKITLDSNEYYVLGDNRHSSFDSRRFGPIEQRRIVGKVLLRAWPFQRARAFSHPEYSY